MSYPVHAVWKLSAVAMLVMSALLVSGCATRPPENDPNSLAEYRENNDPLEPTNRFLYRVNDAIDGAVVQPVAQGYRFVVPGRVRRSIGHALSNVSSPTVFANDVLQGHPRRAAETLTRFVVNSTIGLGGFFDTADSLGLPPHRDGDFGTTLAVWGVGGGPYLFLPLFGPSNARDATGLAGNAALDPFVWASQERIAADQAVTMLVNNAGISLNGSLLENGPEELQRIIAVNITAPTLLAHSAGNAFVGRKRGTIVNIASVLAVAPEMFDGVYSGTKAYLLNLSLNLASKVSAAGVHVQAVLPGATRTEIWQRSGKNPDELMPGMVMDVDDLVDAALLGLDRGETVTIPPLHDETLWTTYETARLALAPNLSRKDVAPRYRVAHAAAA